MVEVEASFAPPTSPDTGAPIGVELVANQNCVPNCPTATVPHEGAKDLIDIAILQEDLARSHEGCQGLRDTADNAWELAETSIDRSNATHRGCLGPLVIEKFGFKIEWCRAKCTSEEGERPRISERFKFTRPQRSDQ